MGGISGEVLKVAKFYAQLAREFRDSLSFYHLQFPIHGVHKAQNFHKTERRRRHKDESIPCLRKFPSAIADLITLLRNAKWVAGKQGSGHPDRYLKLWPDYPMRLLLSDAKDGIWGE